MGKTSFKAIAGKLKKTRKAFDGVGVVWAKDSIGKKTKTQLFIQIHHLDVNHVEKL